MATIEDVAKLAGVSRMTVSRVINNSGYVGKETRKNVESAIQAMNFKPNQVAKALATKKQKTIAYVMVNIADPFHNIVKQGFESVAYHRTYTSIMCDVHSAKRQQDYIDSFQENRTGGVVFHHLAITQDMVDELKNSGIECVLIDNEYDLDGVSMISTDNYSGAKMAVNYLIERGHKQIACVHGVLEPYSGRDVPYEDTFQFRIWHQRTDGFKDAMKENGLNPNNLFQCNGRADIAVQYADAIIDQILASSDKITAIYCENDIMALTIVKTLQERNVKIPDQIAIVGHDGLDMVSMLHPQITTVAQPRHEMGKLAAEILIDQIENHSEPQKILLEPKLIAGETT